LSFFLSENGKNRKIHFFLKNTWKGGGNDWHFKQNVIRLGVRETIFQILFEEFLGKVFSLKNLIWKKWVLFVTMKEKTKKRNKVFFKLCENSLILFPPEKKKLKEGLPFFISSF